VRSYRRDVFERLGPFDEDLLRSQDSELTFRVLRAGGRVLLVPGFVATYYARAALGKLWRMFFQYGYFKLSVARKVGAVMTARQLVPALFVFTVGLAAVFAPWFGPRAHFALPHTGRLCDRRPDRRPNPRPADGKCPSGSHRASCSPWSISHTAPDICLGRGTL